MPDLEPMKVSPRSVKHSSQAAMNNDVLSGIIELILNSDDSYYRLEQDRRNSTGKIVLKVDRGRGRSSRISVLDQAEGMDKQQVKRILVYGERTSGFGGYKLRGFYGRGLKDAIIGLGEYGTLASLKDNRIIVYKLHSKEQKQEVIYDGVASEQKKREYGLVEGTKTKVEIILNKEVIVPQFPNIKERVQNNFLLRNVTTNPKRELIMEAYTGNERAHLFLKKQSGKTLLCKPDVRIKGTLHSFDICVEQASQPLTQEGPDRMGGLLVISGNTVHDCSLFGYDKEPAASRVFGEIRCDYIDELLNKEEMVVKPDRSGINQKNDFGKALYAQIKKTLKPIIDELIKAEQKREEKLLDKETKESLKKAIDEMNRIAKNELNISGSAPAPPSDFELPKNGFAFVPPFASPNPVEKGEECTFHLRIQCPDIVPSYGKVRLKRLNENVEVHESEIDVASGKELKDGLMEIEIVTKGVQDGSSGIAAVVDDIDGNELNAEAVVEVISGIPPPETGIVFERDKYNVKIGKKEGLKVIVDTRIVDENIPFTVEFLPGEGSEIDDVFLFENDIFVTPSGGNITTFSVSIEGKRIGSKGNLVVKYEERNAFAEINVVAIPPSKKSGIISGISFREGEPVIARCQFDSSSGIIWIYTNEKTIGQYYNRQKDLKKAETKALVAELVSQEFFSFLAKKRIADGHSDYAGATDEITAFQLEKQELEVKYCHLIHKIIAKKY